MSNILSATPIDEQEKKTPTSILSAEPVDESEGEPTFIYDEQTDSHMGVSPDMNENDIEYTAKTKLHGRSPDEFVGGIDITPKTEQQTSFIDVAKNNAIALMASPLSILKGVGRFVSYDLPNSAVTHLENAVRSGAFRPAAMKEAGVDSTYWGPAAERQADAIKGLQAKHTELVQRTGLMNPATTATEQVATDFGAGIGQVGVNMGLGIISGAPILVGAVIGGGMTMADQIQKARTAGESPDGAFGKSLLPTAVSATLEGIGNGAIVKAITRNVRVGKYIAGLADWIRTRPLLNTGLVGATQEMAQNITTDTWERLNSWDEDTVVEIAGATVYSGLIGFLTMGAVGHISIQQTKNALRDNPAFQDLAPAQQDAVVATIMSRVEANDAGILDEATDIVARQADPALLGYDNPLALGYDKQVQQAMTDVSSEVAQITTTPDEQLARESDDGIQKKSVRYRKQAIKTEVEDVNRQIAGLEQDYARSVDPHTRAQVSIARNLGRIDARLGELEDAYSELSIVAPDATAAAQLAENKATYNDPTLTDDQMAEQRQKVRALIDELREFKQTGRVGEKVIKFNEIASEIMAFAKENIRGAKTAASLHDSQVFELIKQLKSELSALKQDRALLKSIDTKPDGKLAHSLEKKLVDLKRRRLLLVREEALLSLANHWEQENPAVQLTLEQFQTEKRADFQKRVQAYRDGYRKGEKQGSKDTRQSIKAVQDEFTKFIMDNVPRQYAWKMVRKIKDADTPARMERLMGNIQKQIDRFDKKILFSEIKTLAASLTKSKTIDIGYLAEINTILAQVGITHPKTLQARISVMRDSVMDKLTQGIPAQLQHLVLQNLWNLTEKQVGDMSLGELHALKGSLEALAEEGKSEQKKHKAMLETYKKEFLRVFGMQGQKPMNRTAVVKKLPPGVIFDELSKTEQFKLIFEQRRADVMATLGKMKEWLTSLDLSMLPIMVVGDTFDSGKGYYNGAHCEYLIRPMQQGFSNQLADTHRVNGAAKSLAEKLKLRPDNFTRIGIFAAIQQEGGIEKVLGSGYGQDSTVKMVDYLRTPDGRKMAEIYAKHFGYALENAMDALVAKAQETDLQRLVEMGLLPEEQQFYDFMQQEFAKIFPILQETARVYHNLDLKKINGYFRFDFDFENTREWQLQERFAEATGTIMPNESAQVKKTKVQRSMTKERKGGTNAIKLDAFEVFTKYVNDAYYYIHMTPYLEGVKSVVLSPEYTSEVGEVPREYMTDWLDTVARKGGQDGDQYYHWLDSARHHGYLALLAWRMSTAAIQTTSMIVGLANVSPVHMTNSLGTMWVRTPANTKVKSWLAGNFPTYLGRSLDDPSILDNFNQTEIDRLMNGWASPMAAIKKMDKLSAGTVLLGAYRQYFTENKLPVPSMEEMVSNPPDVNAKRYAEAVMAKTQGSPYFIDLPLMLARGKNFGGQRALSKAWFMLGTYNMMVPWTLMRYDAIGVGLKRRDPVQAGRVIGALLLASMGAQGIRMIIQNLTTAILGGRDKPEEEDFWDTYWSKVFNDQIKTIPFIGDAASLAMHQKMNNVMLSTLWEMGGNATRWHQASKTEKDTENEDTRDKAKLRINKAQTDMLLTSAEWATPGGGWWRLLLNEQIKEIMLDRYDVEIDNINALTDLMGTADTEE